MLFLWIAIRGRLGGFVRREEEYFRNRCRYVKWSARQKNRNRGVESRRMTILPFMKNPDRKGPDSPKKSRL